MTFDFKFLPTCINDIISNNVEEMELHENRQEHRPRFQPCLDIINSAVISYSAMNDNVIMVFSYPNTGRIVDIDDNRVDDIYMVPNEVYNLDEYLLHSNWEELESDEEDSDESDYYCPLYTDSEDSGLDYDSDSDSSGDDFSMEM